MKKSDSPQEGQEKYIIYTTAHKFVQLCFKDEYMQLCRTHLSVLLKLLLLSVKNISFRFKIKLTRIFLNLKQRMNSLKTNVELISKKRYSTSKNDV